MVTYSVPNLQLGGKWYGYNDSSVYEVPASKVNFNLPLITHPVNNNKYLHHDERISAFMSFGLLTAPACYSFKVVTSSAYVLFYRRRTGSLRWGGMSRHGHMF